jgi:DNA repair protein RecN (Recombination protein N)
MSLRRLVVEDFQLIARAEMEFSGGLTAITGETGSGKTMLLDAIDFVLGARAAGDAVRKGRKRARVAIECDVDDRLGKLLAEQGLETDDDVLVIVRELSEGKTCARVCGIPMTAGQLRALGAEIAEIVGQHEAQRLLAPPEQLDALDRFGGEKLLALLDLVGETYRRRARLEAELRDLEAGADRAAADADYAAFASREIAELAPTAGEDVALRERRELLANAERIAAALQSAHGALAGETEISASDLLGSAAAALSDLAPYGKDLEELAAAAEALQSECSELAAQIRRRLERAGLDPGELETITERLAALDRLKKKYGTTLEAVLEAKRRFDETIERFERGDDRRARLQRERDLAAAELDRAARALTAARKRAAAACEKRIAAELAALAMPAARFEIAFEALDQIGSRGAERCEFRLAANPGEPPRALAKAASGGELSRVMLALTVVLADRSARKTLIFDEIDAGVGGATANAVGARLADLAGDLQVICVTHLAQIAAFAETQLALRKHETKETTTIELVGLDRQSRLEELARMLSGATTGVSLEHAKALLRDHALALRPPRTAQPRLQSSAKKK